MKAVMFITSALRRVCPQGLLLGGLLVTLTPGLRASGYDHGFFWYLYVNGGSANITFPNGDVAPGSYTATWANVGDVIAGKGWNPGFAHSIGYNCQTLTNYNNVSIYGWTTGPLIEYYVCELGSVAAGTLVGTLASDGHVYNVYKHQKVNMPSIIGTATYWQYLSNWGGSSIGANHAVNMTNHFNYWKTHIGSLGTYNLQVLAVEAYGGKTGTASATVWGL